MHKSDLKSVMVALLAMAFWGMTFVWVKIVLVAFNPITILLIRLSISSVLLLTAMALMRRFQKIEVGDYKLFAISALFQPFLYFLGETHGLSYVSSALGSIVISTIPVFTPIGSWLAYRERLGLKNLLGFLTSFVGIVLIAGSEKSVGGTSTIGVLLLLMAVAAAIANAVTVKKLTETYSPIMVVTMQNLFGVVYFIPLFFMLDYPRIDGFSTDPVVWRNLIALAVFGSTLAFLFFTYAIKTLGINRASIYSNLIPVFTALFAFVFIGEKFPPVKIIGMAVVLGGVLFVTIRNKKGETTNHSN